MAKKIRNLVTHQGKKVSEPDARFVIQTVYKLLQHLGSTLELELALLGLKRYVESNQISPHTEVEADGLVRDYFMRNKAPYSYTELPELQTKRGHPKLRCQLAIEFGQYRILVETRVIIEAATLKFFEPPQGEGGGYFIFRSNYHLLVFEVSDAIKMLNLTQGIVVIFSSAKDDILLTQWIDYHILRQKDVYAIVIQC